MIRSVTSRQHSWISVNRFADLVDLRTNRSALRDDFINCAVFNNVRAREPVGGLRIRAKIAIHLPTVCSDHTLNIAEVRRGRLSVPIGDLNEAVTVTNWALAWASVQTSQTTLRSSRL